MAPARQDARSLIMLGVLAVWAVGLEARLVYLQVVEHESYVGKAEQPAAGHDRSPRRRAATSSIATASCSRIRCESFDVYAESVRLRDRSRPPRRADDLRGVWRLLGATNWRRSRRSCARPKART